MTVTAWREAAHVALPYARAAQREHVIREALALLDVGEDRFLAHWFLALHSDEKADLATRIDLVRARRYAFHPWVDAAARELILPILEESERPLALRTSSVTMAEVHAFVDARLDPGSSANARAETIRALVHALIGLKTIVRAGRGFIARRTHPSPVAIGWLLGWQLRLEHRHEMSNAEAYVRSTAAIVYALTPTYAQHCVQVATARKQIEQSYLASEARILRVNDGPAV